MKVFLSWSGKKSADAAHAFAEWLPCVIQKAQPWISSKDIDRGSIWIGEIYSQLADCNHGIIFVTKENQVKPWILFEAGALSKGISENRVCTLLVDLNVRDIESSSPLSHLNHTNTSKDQIFELIKTINKRLQEEAVPEQVLSRTFELMWNDFSQRLEEIKNSPDEVTTPERKDDDVLNDILENVLMINRKISRPSANMMLRGGMINPRKAKEIIKILTDLDLDQQIIESILSGITPQDWLHNQLTNISKTDDSDFAE